MNKKRHMLRSVRFKKYRVNTFDLPYKYRNLQCTWDDAYEWTAVAELTVASPLSLLPVMELAASSANLVSVDAAPTCFFRY